MGLDLGAVELFRWLLLFFPSFSEAIKIIGPLLLFGGSVLGVFSSILPDPGSQYRVPDKDDIDIELKGKGFLVYKFTKLSRWITIKVNVVLRSKPYNWFHTSTVFVANLINRIKGGKSKSESVGITDPKPYKFNIKKFQNKMKNQDDEE